jgi:hypothetical protein
MAPFMRIPAALLLLGLLLGGCAEVTPTKSESAQASPTVANSFSPSSSPLALADAATCPSTKPSELAAGGEERPFSSSAMAFGNSHLWVVPLQADGVIHADSRSIEPDGSIAAKLGWWRITPGTLAIIGRRLDASAPPLRASIPEGYGSSGFQASGVWFPTEGCWEITGTVGGQTLSFVTFVLRT